MKLNNHEEEIEVEHESNGATYYAKVTVTAHDTDDSFDHAFGTREEIGIEIDDSTVDEVEDEEGNVLNELSEELLKDIAEAAEIKFIESI